MLIRKIVFVAALILVVGLLSASAIPVKAAGTVTQKTLYAGEVSQTAYGFGNTATSITSPGPTLNLVEGTTYNMTVYNVSSDMDHSWEITTSETASTSPLWGAGIDISTYIPPGGSGSVEFTPTQTGNFYYVCTFPGHIALGMYGKVVVSSPIPEFPSPLTLMFMALAVTGMAAFMAKQKTKIKRFF